MKRKTRYVLLGLLQEEQLTGYDMKKAIDMRMASFWAESYGQIYPTLNALLEEGLVSVHAEDKGNREKRVYAITKQGRSEFLWWLMQENEKETTRHEFLLKLFLSTPAQSATLRRHVQAYRLRCQQQLALYQMAQAQLEKIQALHSNHRQILMVLSLGIRMQQLYLGWCDEVDGQLQAMEKEVGTK